MIANPTLTLALMHDIMIGMLSFQVIATADFVILGRPV